MTDAEGFWARARRRQRENAPRTAAVRRAYENARSSTPECPEQAEATIRAELIAEGVIDAKPAEVDLLVEALLTSPAKAVTVGVFGVLKGINAIRRDFAHLRIPQWVEPPRGAPRYDWADDQESVDCPVLLDPEGGDTISRLFAELGEQEGDDSQIVRLLDCWISLPVSTGPREVPVNVGRFLIGRLDETHSPAAQRLLVALPGRQKGLAFSAELYGTGPDSATLMIRQPAGA